MPLQQTFYFYMHNNCGEDNPISMTEERKYVACIMINHIHWKQQQFSSAESIAYQLSPAEVSLNTTLSYISKLRGISSATFWIINYTD